MGSWKYWKTIHFNNLGTWKYWNTNDFNNLGTWKYWITNDFEDLGTWKYWNPWGRARPGPAHIWARTFFRNSIQKKNSNIQYIIECGLFDMISKKARAEK